VPLPQLHRVRWAVRATLALGVAASVVANVLHAHPNPVSQAIAAWPPLALLLTVELISRVPVHRRSLAAARLAATAAIAAIAAWVSYWHMAGVAARYGETGASPYLMPLSVDGLIIVASICLVELGGRINAAQRRRAEATATPAPAISAPEGASATGAPDVTGAPEATGAAARPQGALARPKATARKPRQAAPRPRRPVTETAALAAELQAGRPGASEADIAQALGITTSRLRAVRREARARELELAA
jgi:hypothetical protein